MVVLKGALMSKWKTETTSYLVTVGNYRKSSDHTVGAFLYQLATLISATYLSRNLLFYQDGKTRP